MRSWQARVLRRALTAIVRTVRRASGGVPDPAGPLEDLEAYALRLRAQVEELGARIRLPDHVRVTPADGAPTRALWVVDDAARTAPGDDPVRSTDRIVLHLHGGAYVLGSPETHRSLAASLSRTGQASVLLPSYRLAPEHRAPAALDDAAAAYRWLVEERGVDPARVVLSGDSAGGGLAAALLVRLRDEGAPLPAAYAGMSPWMDLAGTGSSLEDLAASDPWLTAALVGPAARAYAGDVPLEDPAVSPLYADLAGLPPMLVHVGSDEILLDDAIRFVDRAREAGVDASVGRFEGLWHVFHVFPGLPERRAALLELGGFVRRHTAGDADLAPRRFEVRTPR